MEARRVTWRGWVWFKARVDRKTGRSIIITIITLAILVIIVVPRRDVSRTGGRGRRRGRGSGRPGRGGEESWSRLGWGFGSARGFIIWVRDRSGLSWIRRSRSRTRWNSFGNGDGLVIVLGLRFRLEDSNVRGYWPGGAARRRLDAA